MPLPLEDYPHLLQEYGRAFAIVNLVEWSLKHLILVESGLKSARTDITDQILDEMMLGKKIRLAEKLLPAPLIKKLWKLNDYRLLLAHGVTGEQVPVDNPTIKTGKLIIDHKKKTIPFTEELLKKIYVLADEVSEELRLFKKK